MLRSFQLFSQLIPYFYEKKRLSRNNGSCVTNFVMWQGVYLLKILTKVGERQVIISFLGGFAFEWNNGSYYSKYLHKYTSINLLE